MNNEIFNLYGVRATEDIDFKQEIKNRVQFLKDYIRKSKTKGLVLGISGGVDSTAAGRLCQIACRELRNEGYVALFTAVRLPYGEQKDESDAQDALNFIFADIETVVPIGLATNAITKQMPSEFLNSKNSDFHKGNIKARIRMIAQYAIAGVSNSLVVGTDHNAELVMGFYTKFGDGAADITPLSGLNKRQVRLLAKELGARMQLWNKVATADLEDKRPQLSDEEALGISYDDIDDVLEGKKVSDEVFVTIMAQFNKTRHKREPIVAYTDYRGAK